MLAGAVRRPPAKPRPAAATTIATTNASEPAETLLLGFGFAAAAATVGGMKLGTIGCCGAGGRGPGSGAANGFCWPGLDVMRGVPPVVWLGRYS